MRSLALVMGPLQRTIAFDCLLICDRRCVIVISDFCRSTEIQCIDAIFVFQVNFFMLPADLILGLNFIFGLW